MDILETIKTRFEQNPNRHKSIQWNEVLPKIDKPTILESLRYMEETGGEPDIVYDEENGLLLACDCSKESPSGRRSLCYDEKARLGRKKNAPASSAMEEAKGRGISLMNLEIYTFMQTVGEFDLSSSSWIEAPEDIRAKGGALFCEKRYGHVFHFHNGADSYYSNRGWRGYIVL